MLRQRLTDRDRVRIFAAHDGICHLCGCKIWPGERWEVSHPIALELGGQDDDTNRAPAHFACHKLRTAQYDMPAIAKVKRVRAKHLGAHRSQRPMACGRRSPWKKRLDGTVVRR